MKTVCTFCSLIMRYSNMTMTHVRNDFFVVGRGVCLLLLFLDGFLCIKSLQSIKDDNNNNNNNIHQPKTIRQLVGLSKQFSVIC